MEHSVSLRLLQTLAASTALALLAPLTSAQTTGFNQTGTGPFDYNTPANWVDGDINGIWDPSLTIPSSQTVTFDANTALSTGLSFEYTGSGNLTLRGTGGDFTLTLGGDILHNTASNSRTVNFGSSSADQALNVNLGGATRTFTVGSGRSLGFVNVISNGGVVTSGGTINFSGANTYSGTTTVTSGVLALNGANGSVANSDVTVQAGGSSNSVLQFNSTTSGNTGTTRAQSVTLDGAGSNVGASLNVTGNSGANSLDTISGALTATAGHNTVTVTANASRSAQLSAGTLVREHGATLLLRGSNLGQATIADQTAGHANIHFTTAPTLVGGTGSAGQTTLGIIKGVFGDTLTSGNGASATGGLVTYDATRGVRLLDTATEYAASITDGQPALDNVRLANSSGIAAVTTLDSATTINSLSLSVTAASSAITLDGAGALTLNSGVLHASSLSPANAGAEMTINNTLDLNATEGVFIFATVGSSNGIGGALLRINGAITNDAGNGLTLTGQTGVLEMAGTASNTYTGVTTVNSGGVRLAKTGGATAIIGNLVVNGGTVQNTGNQIADTSDITINGGLLTQKGGATNSGSGAHETFRDLTLNGGMLTSGASGTSSGITNLRNATVSGGTWNVTRGHKANLSGDLALNGGFIDILRANSTSQTTRMTLDGDLTLTNTDSGPYTAIALGGGTAPGVAGGELVLKGNVTFIGNGSNANTVSITAAAATSGGGEGTVSLEGIRTFTIGDGAADDDLTVQAVLADGSVTGGLIKTGAGTLLLEGVNTYTGVTTLTGGTLRLGAVNSLASSSGLVMAGGVLDTAFNQSLGTLELTASSLIDLGDGDVSLLFADSSALAWDESVTLGIVNFDESLDSIRFGSDINGLGETQLARITLNGFAVDIDANGYLFAVPEPSSAALLTGLCGILFAGLRRRRR